MKMLEKWKAVRIKEIIDLFNDNKHELIISQVKSGIEFDVLAIVDCEDKKDWVQVQCVDWKTEKQFYERRKRIEGGWHYDGNYYIQVRNYRVVFRYFGMILGYRAYMPIRFEKVKEDKSKRAKERKQ